MPTDMRRVLLEMAYEKAATKYLYSLPLEHFMEATPQATQREITLESLALVKAQRPDVHVFNELLVQYPLPRRRRPGQVVPDNMIVLHPRKIEAEGSYNLPFQPVGPFCVMEYVSKYNKRKDYNDNMKKYERELKVPYYLMFMPEAQEMTLYRHNGEKYVSVKPNELGRCEIPELELEVALLGGWMRYWFRGDLLPLPADWQNELNKERERYQQERQARLAEQQARLAEQQARLAAEQEVTRLRAELERLKQTGKD